MNRLLTEFIGTFFLVLTIGLATLGDNPALPPLAIGAMLMVMVYMGGPISGAHYNPAVTLALFIRGACKLGDVVPYMISQIAGAAAAAALAAAIRGSSFAPAPAANLAVWIPLAVEILFTFALALVVLNVATNPKVSGNSYYGLAIGFTVLAAAMAGGGLSGGAFNPAVGVGPIMVDTIHGGNSLSNLWLYLVGPFAGGALAAVIYKLQHPAS